MGSNQSKPEGKKNQATNSENATPAVDYGSMSGYFNMGGISSLPSTPVAPITANMSAVRRTATAPPRIHVEVHELEGHSNVSRPPPPQRLRHLSELIDPEDIPRNSHVRSPSGNVLDAEQYAAHPDRPRSMRERREEILKRVEAESAAAAAAAAEGAGLRALTGDGVRTDGQVESVSPKTTTTTLAVPKETKPESKTIPPPTKAAMKEKKQKWWTRILC